MHALRRDVIWLFFRVHCVEVVDAISSECCSLSRPDYIIGIVVGKFLRPTTSKGLRKMAVNYSEHILANRSLILRKD